MENNFDKMKKYTLLLVSFLLTMVGMTAIAQQRRPIDHEHPLWMVHVDVWNKADPQKIIDLIPEHIRPYVCMNLSLSAQYDNERLVYKMPQQAVRTYKSWATVCQHNGVWFTCQPASGGYSHIPDDDLVTFEYFFKHYPNFLGWNYAEQFWGFDDNTSLNSGKNVERIALFAKLVEMSHNYGGFLTVSYCGNIYSYGLTPVGMLKRNADLLEACRKYPDAILWLDKYTTSSCFYSTESVTMSPFISGLAQNYGVRYDVSGWESAMGHVVGEGMVTYPSAAGIAPVMEQTGVNGGAVWDGPELIWTEDFREKGTTTVAGYKRRNWETFPTFDNIWLDMFSKVIDGTLRILSRQEVVERTKVAVINDVTTGSDEDKYAGWGDLYDGLYKQDDPANVGTGQLNENYTYFKKTGRYMPIPVCVELHDVLARSIPVQVKKTQRTKTWSSQDKKVAQFNELYPEVSSGDLYVARLGNQLIAYTPYTYLNGKTTAEAEIPLLYNTCEKLQLKYGKLSSGVVREYADHIDFYLNNYRTDTTTMVTDRIMVTGAVLQPTFTMAKRADAKAETSSAWDEMTNTFTLEVTHMGPVDIILNCAGSAARKETPEVVPLPLPVQPEPYTGPIIIEAEDMDYKSVKKHTTNPYGDYPTIVGHTGNGFVDMGTNQAASLRHQLTLKQGGVYTVTVRYTNATRKGNLSIYLNGTTQTVSCEKAETNQWKKATLEVELKEGTNDLRINNTSMLPLYIDQIIYAPAGTEREKYLVAVRESDFGSVTADVTEAYEGDTVTLYVDADINCELEELKLVNSVFHAMAKTIAFDEDASIITFIMPDDNVTIQPVFANNNIVYELDFAEAGSSSIPMGWRTTDGSDIRQYPNTYNSGSRIMSGFGGYQGKGLYWRNGSAEYGRLTDYRMTLTPGKYLMNFVMAAWKGTPTYKVQILDAASGKVIATSSTLTASPNASGNYSADLSSAKVNELPFTIGTEGNYVIKFSAVSSGYSEYLLLDCNIVGSNENSIETPHLDDAPIIGIYDLQGRKLPAMPKKGIVIVRDAEGNTRKIIAK